MLNCLKVSSLSLAVFLIIIVVSVADCALIDSGWTGSGDGTNWSDASNWNPAVVPNNNATNTYNVTIQNAAVNLAAAYTI